LIAMESPGLSGRPVPLQDMFTEVPPRYDLVNRIVTLGLDARWRRLAALMCLREGPSRVLDLGSGTGDLAISIARFAGKAVAVTALDFSLPMLRLARRKASLAGVADRVDFILGGADSLPFPDACFDAVGISFAFRNLTYKSPLRFPHLAEVGRVLRPGGRYVIVESSQPENPVIRALCHLYLRTFVGLTGTLLSGNSNAYRYLVSSTVHFFSPHEVREMLLAAGFGEVFYRPLFLGAAGIHVAVKTNKKWRSDHESTGFTGEK
jgi:demethylmenaquinone methyltransferase/2-methoxy-6-polyprenyl-1,4-benzoquinol methylase